MEKEADEIDDHIETLKKRLKMLSNRGEGKQSN